MEAKLLETRAISFRGKFFVFGIWEPNLTNFVQQRLRVGDTFVDVGANLGYYSLLASKLVGALGHVVAIEASPAIAAHLTKNLHLNNATNVRVVNAAAADRAGTLALYRGPSDKYQPDQHYRSERLQLRRRSGRVAAVRDIDRLRACCGTYRKDRRGGRGMVGHSWVYAVPNPHA